jgi:hypothetical protein
MPSHRIPKLFKDNQSNIEKTLANVHMGMLLCIHKVETEKKQPKERVQLTKNGLSVLVDA